MYEIRIGSIDEVIESEDLQRAHWFEVAKNKELMVLNPDVDSLRLLEQKGNLVTLIAMNDGYIVGYSCSILHNHLHYRQLKMAQNDLLFIHPNYRNSPLGLRLMKETERVCKQFGVDIYCWRAKEDTSLYKILDKKGYARHEVVFTKRLQED